MKFKKWKECENIGNGGNANVFKVVNEYNE